MNTLQKIRAMYFCGDFAAMQIQGQEQRIEELEKQVSQLQEELEDAHYEAMEAAERADAYSQDD